MRENTKFGEALIRTKKNENLYCKTHNQYELVKAVYDNQIVVLSGPPGTGKTFISTLLAVKYLTEGVVEKIIIIRPAVEAGEHLGFLPGTLSEKLDPYMKPIYDVLDMVQLNKEQKKQEPAKGRTTKGQTRAQKTVEEMQTVHYDNKVELVSIAHCRGRTFNNAFVIADEMQNATKEQMKMVMTRIGFGTKMIIDGDIKQSDIGYDNGLRYVTEKLKVNEVDEVKLIQFDDHDIVRNKIISHIEKLFTNKYNLEGVVHSNQE